MMQIVWLGLRGILAVALAAFFGFVGWMKAFAAVADLRLHHAWTAWAPQPIGRAVGWSEMAGAALLVGSMILLRLAPWQRIVALYFVANQVVAAAVHLAVGEAGALPQNAVLAAAFILLAVTAPPRSTDNHPRESPA